MPDSSGRLIGLSIIFLAGAVLMLNGHPGNAAIGGIVVVVAGILFAVELWHSRSLVARKPTLPSWRGAFAPELRKNRQPVASRL